MISVDWPALIRAGLSDLRLRPGELWNLTPIEFLVLAGRTGGAPPTTREALDRLTRQFPDQRNET